MPWYFWRGKLLYKTGIATSDACYCLGGCCPGILLSSDTLIATVTAADGGAEGCWTVTDSRELTQDVAPFIWTIGGNSTDWDATWLGLNVTCANNVMTMVWDTNGTSACPETTGDWVLQSATCIPDPTWVFKTTLIEDILCPCDTGTITMTLTIKP